MIFNISLGLGGGFNHVWIFFAPTWARHDII